MKIEKEFTGMLPAAIAKFEKLLIAIPDATIEKGYNVDAGKDSFFAWGCACRITANDMANLKSKAEMMDITWLSNDGDMAYTNNLTINDFKTFRVNGDLVLMSEEEVK